MISSIGFAPHPPALIPAVASGAAVELEALRAACDAMIVALLAGADSLLIIGSEQGVEIGSWLVARNTATTEMAPPPATKTVVLEPGDTDTSDALSLANQSAHRVAVLAMGDGSACRSEKAPGYFDERSFEFDDAVATALRDADAASLGALDQSLADQLLVAGRLVWPLVARVVQPDSQGWSGDLTFRDDPYGVSYFVALWRPVG